MARGVLGTSAVKTRPARSSTATTSVNAPPVSIPIR